MVKGASPGTTNTFRVHFTICLSVASKLINRIIMDSACKYTSAIVLIGIGLLSVFAYAETMVNDASLLDGAPINLTVDQGLWENATQHPDNWRESSWFGWFYDMGYPWISHAEHGYQYCLGVDTSSVYLYDLSLKTWIWTSESMYPHIFIFGVNPGWYMYVQGGGVGNRWFWRNVDQVYVLEDKINESLDFPLQAVFSLVPAGTFMMGDMLEEGDRDERPAHEVNVSAFKIQQTEVTNAQMAEVMNWAIDAGLVFADAETVRNLTGDNQELLNVNDQQCQFSWNGRHLVVYEGKENYPATEVTWFGAMAYCYYLTEKEGNLSQAIDLNDWSFDIHASGYRLPTEAEWEKAARGGLSGARFPWGNTLDQNRANYKSSLVYDYDTTGISRNHPIWSEDVYPWTCPVNEYPDSRNSYGLYNLAGNVVEYCADWYDDEYYDHSIYDNPTGPETGTYRVIRGGNWGTTTKSCRVAERWRVSPKYTSAFGHRGLRPVCSEGSGLVN